MKSELFGKDYGLPIDSFYYQLSNSALRREYREEIPTQSDEGPLIVSEILRRCGNSKYFKIFLEGVDFNEFDRHSLELFQISQLMNLDYENIFKEPEKKRSLLKHNLNYDVLITGKDKLTKEKICELIEKCNKYRVGRVFQSVCRKGKSLMDKINQASE
ncbi:MAG TPA: hypothetical protein HA284_01235 [Nanoarchaeota archaeon]|nr:hypothetical protein [Nanoarchaeota archaeon]